MTITLRPDQEKLIAQAMETGAYRDMNEVVERALEMLCIEDELLSDDKEEIADRIERAFAQFDRGEYYSAEESRAEMSRRKAEWLCQRQPQQP
jgi:hypothetical protein